MPAWIGGPDDHISGRSGQVPFNPTRPKNSEKNSPIDILDAVMPTIEALTPLVPEIRTMTQADLRIKMSEDRGFAAVIWVLYIHQKQITALRREIQTLQNRTNFDGPIG